DRRHRHVVAIEADRRDVPLVDVDEVLVDPAVGLGPVRVEGLAVGTATDVLHLADAPALDARTGLAELGGQPGLPDVRRLDDVVVDTDDLRQFAERVLARRRSSSGGALIEHGHGYSPRRWSAATLTGI